MADVKVEQSQDNAILLLDAADKAGEDPGVVRTTSKGYLVVDEALAKKAGVKYTTEEDEEKAFQQQLAADDEASGYERDAESPRKRAVKKAAAKKTAPAKE